MWKHLGIVLAVILLLLFIAWKWMPVSYRIPMNVSTFTGSDFSWSPKKDYDIKNAQYECLLGTPYIYVVKRKTIQDKENSPEFFLMSLNLIDIEKGERILQTEWINEPIRNGGSNYTVSPAYAIQNHPYIALYGYQINLPFYYHFVPESSIQDLIKANWQKYATYQYYSLDASGRFNRINQIPYWMYPPLPGCSTFPGLDAAKQDLAEYQVAPNGDCIQTTVWKGAGMPSSCFPSPDGSYFGYVVKKDTYTFFLRSDPPTFRDFTPNEIAAIRPTSSNSTGKPSFLSLSRQANQPCLLADVTDASGSPINQNALFPIYEIQVDKIANGALKDIFKVIGTSNGKYPLGVLHDNTALILYNQPTSPLDQSEPVFPSIVLRETNPDGSLGSFGSDINEFPVSGMIQPKVLDSERLIFIRDNALWTVQWDGSGEKRVFPRK